MGSPFKIEAPFHKRRYGRAPLLTRVVAPKTLSLIRDPEGTAAFVSQLKTLFDARRPVFVDLSGVKNIDYGGLTVMLSAIVRFRSKRIRFNGNYPQETIAKKLLVESDFFDLLLNGKFKDRDEYRLKGGSSILTHAKKKVDAELGAAIVAEAAKTVWSEPRRCPGVQRTLIELMQNTLNHAAPKGEGDRHWWVSVYHHAGRERVTFSFVDYGVGVFASLARKAKGHPLYGVLDSLVQRVKHGKNAEVLKLIFEGELHRTVTGKYYRGKGLPTIYGALQKGQFTNFTMVTNRVYFDSRRNEYRMLNNEFPGTFVSWELVPSCPSLPNVA
jgi:hypothetical protein